MQVRGLIIIKTKESLKRYLQTEKEHFRLPCKHKFIFLCFHKVKKNDFVMNVIRPVNENHMFVCDCMRSPADHDYHRMYFDTNLSFN